MIKFSNNFSIFTPMWTYARRNALRGKRYCLFLFFLFFQLFWWQHSRDGVVSQKNLTFHITFHVTRRRTLTRIIKCKKRENILFFFFLHTYNYPMVLFYIKLWIWKLEFLPLFSRNQYLFSSAKKTANRNLSIFLSNV